jgi:hypothetical protein
MEMIARYRRVLITTGRAGLASLFLLGTINKIATYGEVAARFAR